MNLKKGNGIDRKVNKALENKEKRNSTKLLQKTKPCCILIKKN